MNTGFTAATWNVYHGTPAVEAERVFSEIRRNGVSVVLGQEFQDREQRAIFVDAGWEMRFHPRQYIVAWSPRVWTGIDGGGLRLSDTGYWSKGGDHEQFSEAAWQILCDRVGRSLDALSYHTPSGIQVGGEPDGPQPRVTATRESMASLRERARRSQTKAVLYGGDDNADERRGNRWGFMLRPPLKQIQAPEGTHHARKIDDFRVNGLKAGPGKVIPGGGDHKVHIRDFIWERG